MENIKFIAVPEKFTSETFENGTHENAVPGIR